MLPFPDTTEFSDEVRRIFREFDRLRTEHCRGTSNMYAPALDVVETATAIEVYVDLPGVAPEGLRVLCKEGTLVIVGEKLAFSPCGPEGSAFHLVERGFGRFVRVVRLNAAIDASGARAVLSAGELRITLPRIEERRGREIAIRVEESKGQRPDA